MATKDPIRFGQWTRERLRRTPFGWTQDPLIAFVLVVLAVAGLVAYFVDSDLLKIGGGVLLLLGSYYGARGLRQSNDGKVIDQLLAAAQQLENPEASIAAARLVLRHLAYDEPHLHEVARRLNDIAEASPVDAGRKEPPSRPRGKVG